MTHSLFTSSLHPSFIGFERLFDEISNIEKAVNKNTYPPYNIAKLDDNQFVIEMAIAGFSQDDLDITVEKNRLFIKGNKRYTVSDGQNSDEKHYIHKGISSKAFEQSFTLLPSIVVKGATCKDGMLSIYLENIVPEEHKPRKIAIGNTTKVPEKQLLME